MKFRTDQRHARLRACEENEKAKKKVAQSSAARCDTCPAESASPAAPVAAQPAAHVAALLRARSALKIEERAGEHASVRGWKGKKETSLQRAARTTKIKGKKKLSIFGAMRWPRNMASRARLLSEPQVADADSHSLR